MKDRAPGPALVIEDGEGVLPSLPGVNDQRHIEPQSQLDLGRKNVPLGVSRGVVVVIVEAALAHGDRAAIDQLFQRNDQLIDRSLIRIVRVHARRGPHPIPRARKLKAGA